MRTRVLVLDGYGPAAEKIAEALRRDGYHACVAATARIALRRIAACQHPVAVLDLHLEGVERLASALRRRGVSIVGLTSTEASRGRAGAALVTLQKPFRAEELLAAVRQALEPPDVGP